MSGREDQEKDNSLESEREEYLKDLAKVVFQVMQKNKLLVEAITDGNELILIKVCELCTTVADQVYRDVTEALKDKLTVIMTQNKDFIKLPFEEEDRGRTKKPTEETKSEVSIPSGGTEKGEESGTSETHTTDN